MSRSKIFLWLMLCFIGGVALRSFVLVGDFYLFFGFGAVALFLFSFSKNQKVLLYSTAVIFSLAGVFWYGVSEPASLKLGDSVGRKVEIEGKVAEYPKLKSNTQRLVIAPKEALGERILATAKRYPEFFFGDTVHVSGALKKPENFEKFNYIQYLAKDGIYFLMPFADAVLVKEGDVGFWRRLYSFRREFERNIGGALSFPQSAFASGIILGSDADMPKELNEAFIASGVSHVTALSGYNITIIVISVSLVLSYLLTSRLAALLFSFGVVAMFVLMTGASPSVVRAAIMGAALLIAKYLGREGGVLPILVFAAFIMIIFNPKILAFDISFQLSFLAVLGLAYIAPFFSKKLERWPEFFKLKESFITTVSAQLTVLPLALFSFSQFSIIAPLANMLILPFVPMAMFFGFFTGAAGFISAHLAQIFAYPLWLITSYQLYVIEYFANFPFAAIKF